MEELKKKEDCPKCGKSFIDVQHHLEKAKKRSCIGFLFVCKRCGQIFDNESRILCHQTTKLICERLVTVQTDIPREIAVRIRYLKAIEDCGTVSNYLARVVKRGLKCEVTNVLESCSLDELHVIFQLLVHCETKKPAHFFKIISVMSDFANEISVSLEKRAVIREFVDRNITL